MNEQTGYFIKTYKDIKQRIFFFPHKTNYEKPVNFSKELSQKPMDHDIMYK
jgi:hypothetical protein